MMVGVVKEEGGRGGSAQIFSLGAFQSGEWEDVPVMETFMTKLCKF